MKNQPNLRKADFCEAAVHFLYATFGEELQVKAASGRREQHTHADSQRICSKIAECRINQDTFFLQLLSEFTECRTPLAYLNLRFEFQPTKAIKKFSYYNETSGSSL
jgi:hypothetical protein